MPEQTPALLKVFMLSSSALLFHLAPEFDWTVQTILYGLFFGLNRGSQKTRQIMHIW